MTKNLWLAQRLDQAKLSLLPVYKAKKKKNYRKRSFLRTRGVEDWTKKRKESFLTALATVIKKDPTTSLRKDANELKVHAKTVRTAIKQESSTNLNLLDFAIWGVLENKTNASSHLNIGSLKIAIEEDKIKYQKSIFWRQANRFKGVLIELLK